VAPAAVYSTASLRRESPQSVPASSASSALPRPLSNVARSDLVDIMGAPLYVRTYHNTPRGMPASASVGSAVFAVPGRQVPVRVVPSLDPRPSVRFEEVLADTTSTSPRLPPRPPTPGPPGSYLRRVPTLSSFEVRLEVISEESQHSHLSSGLPLHHHHLSTGASPLATLAPAASRKNFCQGNLTFYFSALLCCSENGVTFYPSSFRAKHLHFSLERLIYQTPFQRHIK